MGVLPVPALTPQGAAAEQEEVARAVEGLLRPGFGKEPLTGRDGLLPGAPALLASSGHQLQNAHLLWYKVKQKAYEQTCFLFDSSFPELVCFPMTAGLVLSLGMRYW